MNEKPSIDLDYEENRRLFLLPKNIFEKFSRKERFWVCILIPLVQMSEGVNSERRNSEPFTCSLKIE